MPSALLTGGTGFIGSHTCVEVIAAGWTPILIDNLCNSSAAVLDRIEAITGSRPAFVKADLRDRAALDRVFADLPIDAVIHFAGLKSVGESVADPLRYYENNVVGTMVLARRNEASRRAKLVFSSSATVYGTAETMPLSEDARRVRSIRTVAASSWSSRSCRHRGERSVAPGTSAALFQSGRRPRERADRRGSARDSRTT